MLDASKIYDFTIAFGEQTDTLDAEGAVIARSDHQPSLSEVEAVLERFTGPLAHVAPVYSAFKLDGQRAYDLARPGDEMEWKTRCGVRSEGRGGGKEVVSTRYFRCRPVN